MCHVPLPVFYTFFVLVQILVRSGVYMSYMYHTTPLHPSVLEPPLGVVAADRAVAEWQFLLLRRMNSDNFVQCKSALAQARRAPDGYRRVALKVFELVSND